MIINFIKYLDPWGSCLGLLVLPEPENFINRKIQHGQSRNKKDP